MFAGNGSLIYPVPKSLNNDGAANIVLPGNEVETWNQKRTCTYVIIFISYFTFAVEESAKGVCVDMVKNSDVGCVPLNVSTVGRRVQAVKVVHSPYWDIFLIMSKSEGQTPPSPCWRT